MTDACLSRDLADSIATLTLNRPDKSNAFDQTCGAAARGAAMGRRHPRCAWCC